LTLKVTEQLQLIVQT